MKSPERMVPRDVEQEDRDKTLIGSRLGQRLTSAPLSCRPTANGSFLFMSNQTDIIKLIKSISGQANVLTIPRLYINLTKSHRAALLLSQCVYWSDRSKDLDGWFYKTFSEWRDELGIPRGGIETAIKAISRWVETKVARVGAHPKTHYRVLLKVLESSILEMLDSSTLHVSDSSTLFHTEITTETTTSAREKTSRAPDPEIILPKVTNEQRSALEKTFTEITGLHPPPNAKEAGIRWWKPLREMIQEANGQSEIVLRAAVKQMKKDSLTFDSPASIQKTFRSCLGQRNLSGMKSASSPDPFAALHEMIERQAHENNR